jgi:hypothetical protein
MSYPVYYVVEGDVLPHFFSSYDGATGASEAISGLAVTDIEIYKDGGTTQRSSDAGYTLLDTDGIDFDGVTGINGFSIDLSDNTDASFYTVGPWYHVVIASVTADAQTVNFVACAFRILSATRGMSGTALPDVASGSAGAVLTAGTGTAQLSVTSGRGNADITHISGDSAAADNLEADYDGTGYAKPASSVGGVTGDVSGSVGSISGTIGTFDALVTAKDDDWSGLSSVETGTLQSATSTTAVLDDVPTTIIASGDRNDNDFLNGMLLHITGGTGAGQTRRIADYTGGTFTCTVAAWLVTPSSDSTYELLPDAESNDVNVTSIAAGAITAAAIATGAIDADALATDAVAEIADGVWDEDATGHQTQGTFGQAIGDPAADTNTIFKAVVTDATGATVGVDGAAIVADTNELQTDWANGGRLDLILDTAASGSLDAGDVRDAIGLATANLDTQLAALPTAAENATEVWTTVLTEAYAAHEAEGTGAELLYGILQMLTEFAISSTTYTVKKLDGTTTAFTITLNDASSPTAAARTA